jgi:hypothetical protein
LLLGDRDLVSVFYMRISSFLSNICWRDCQFSIVCFVLLCQRQHQKFFI